MKKYVLSLIILLFCACESEGPESLEIRKNIDELKKKYKEVELKHKQLRGELQQIWLRSLKYRFSGVTMISMEEIMPESAKDELAFLKSMKFRYLSKQNTIELTCTYKTKERSAKFMLYLFDENGINIYKKQIEHSNWMDPLDKKPEKENITWTGKNVTATYFMIQKAK